MRTARAERVRHVLTGVLLQAVADARASHVSVCGAGADADYLRSICLATLGPESIQSEGLRLDPANKTSLLLGDAPAADILLLGDLYYSQVVELAGAASLGAQARKLAEACKGAERLDAALARLYDERAGWTVATIDLPEPAREQLKRSLEQARFRRQRVGLVPKLGTRTLGIDLYA